MMGIKTVKSRTQLKRFVGLNSAIKSNDKVCSEQMVLGFLSIEPNFIKNSQRTVWRKFTLTAAAKTIFAFSALQDEHEKLIVFEMSEPMQTHQKFRVSTKAGRVK